MGIVAHCPSGHRIKVKDYLAGRKGICPTCGARFRIPLASPVASAARAPSPDTPVAGVADGPSVAAVVSLDPVAAAGLPEVLLVAAVTDHVLPDSPADDPPQVDPDPTAHVEVDDDEAVGDAAYWYVAIPGGEPSAALRDQEMAAWLDGGQATGREVVWRSDWPGWKPITEAFPGRFPEAFPGFGRR